jgi:hypothetical protein
MPMPDMPPIIPKVRADLFSSPHCVFLFLAVVASDGYVAFESHLYFLPVSGNPYNALEVYITFELGYFNTQTPNRGHYIKVWGFFRILRLNPEKSPGGFTA